MHICTVDHKKLPHFYFYNNFDKYEPISRIILLVFALSDELWNQLEIYNMCTVTYSLTSGAPLHVLQKFLFDQNIICISDIDDKLYHVFLSQKIIFSLALLVFFSERC